MGKYFDRVIYRPLLCFNNLLFGDVWRLIINGVRNDVSSVDCMMPATKDISPQNCDLQFSNFAGFRAIMKLFIKQLVCISFVKLLSLSTSLIYPIILMHFIKFLVHPDSNLTSGLLFLLAFCLNSSILGFSSVHYNYLNTKLGFNLKSKLVPSLFREIMKISYAKLSIIHRGQLLDYLTADVDRIVNFFPSIQEIWSMPLQIIISTILLYQQVGVASFAGIAFIVILIPLNKLLANKIGQYSSLFMLNKDERMKIFTDFLQSIVDIKVGCYEKIFYDEISEKRKQELKYLKKQKYLDAFCVIFWAICPVVICALTFTIYALLGHEISQTKVLTSLALFNLLIGPMNSLPWVINGIIEAMISIKRINSITGDSITSPIYSIPHDLLNTSNSLISICRMNFSWSLELDDASFERSTLFKNVNLEIKENEYIGIIGNVGSGKTSFLLALMQEMNWNTNGLFYLSDSIKESSIAYVGQNPWLLKRSIKENIVMFNPYDQRWYNTVIDACGLNVDFLNMQQGDLTHIADHGSSLSGGQKARICLARAIYHRAQIYLLDDPLSSLDSSVAWLIVENVLSSLLIHRTVIMTTHNVKYFSKLKDSIRIPDKIFRIEQGTVLQCDPNSVDVDINTDDLQPVNQLFECGPIKNVMEDDLSGKKEHLEIGTIQSNVYFAYVKFVGYFLAVVIMLSLLLMQGTKNFSEYWLSLWTSSKNNTTKNMIETFSVILTSKISFSRITELSIQQISVVHHIEFFLQIYLIIVGFNFFFGIIRAFSFAYGGIRASYRIHKELLSVLIKAKLQFFQTTSRGQIFNRFTSDLSTIDDNLPFIVNIFLANIFTCIGSFVVVAVSLPCVMFIILPIIYFCYYFQFVYRMTSRAVKRLISINRSPLYSNFSEMIEGMILIRNFRLIDNVIEENNKLLLNLIRCEYSGLLLSSWLAMRLQIIGITFVSAIIVISLIVNYVGYIDKSLIGLACVYSFSLSNILSNVITSATESEKEFIAVERCFEYIASKENHHNIISEFEDKDFERLLIDNPQRCLGFLSEGSVTFNNIYLRYTPNDSFALSDINIKIESGQTVGIIGRTGSGKSSLIKLLFRLSTYEKDLITKRHLTGYCGEVLIDGIDISGYDLRSLRYSLSIMMQDSLIFSRTIRENLDPLSQHTDDELHTIVAKLQFRSYFREFWTHDFNLDGQIANQGRELSYGQRQLLCLGRILLSRNDIICLDEPSSYLDSNTECIIEKIILSDFKEKTVFIVGHRLSMMMRICDSMIVMDNGKIVEFGSTVNLLENAQSYLSQHLKS